MKTTLVSCNAALLKYAINCVDDSTFLCFIDTRIRSVFKSISVVGVGRVSDDDRKAIHKHEIHRLTKEENRWGLTQISS